MAVPLRDEVATRRFPIVTFALIALNVVVFLFVQPSAFQNPADTPTADASEIARNREGVEFAYRWGAVACEVVAGEPLAARPAQCPARGPDLVPEDKDVLVALVTSLFLHGSLLHLAGNMLFLWVFGNNVEDRLGRLGFVVFYLVGGVVASLGYVALNTHSGAPLVGASGAIAAAMGAYLVFHPRGRILTAVVAGTIQLVYLPASIVLVLFFVTQFFTPDNDVAWEAHAVGMAAGFVVALALGRLPAFQDRHSRHQLDDAQRRGVAF